jgi:hypothetical protein
MLAQVAMYFAPSVVRLVSTGMLLTWVWHCLACGYWFISRLQGLGATPWVASEESNDREEVLNYLNSVVWAIQGTFSIGLNGEWAGGAGSGFGALGDGRAWDGRLWIVRLVAGAGDGEDDDDDHGGAAISR